VDAITEAADEAAVVVITAAVDAVVTDVIATAVDVITADEVVAEVAVDTADTVVIITDLVTSLHRRTAAANPDPLRPRAVESAADDPVERAAEGASRRRESPNNVAKLPNNGNASRTNSRNWATINPSSPS
jgi:hypothetical protein